MTDIPPDRDTLPDELAPDYSRLGFRDLRAKCKDRGIPADGTTAELVEKLKAWDAQHGADVDLTVPEGADDEVDLLDLDDEPAPEQPAGGEGGASLPTPPAGPETTPGDPSPPEITNTVLTGRTLHYPTPGSPEVAASTSDAPETPLATLRQGRPNLEARDGVVKVGEAFGAAEVRAFRHEFVIGQHELTDVDHFRYIEQTHAAAAAAGLTTKGGVTVGERVGFGVDASTGQRTAIYQVPLRRIR